MNDDKVDWNASRSDVDQVVHRDVSKSTCIRPLTWSESKCS